MNMWDSLKHSQSVVAAIQSRDWTSTHNRNGWLVDTLLFSNKHFGVSFLCSTSRALFCRMSASVSLFCESKTSMEMQEFSGCARRKDTFFDFLLLLDFLQCFGMEDSSQGPSSKRNVVECIWYLGGGFSPTHLKNMIVKLKIFPK